MDLWCIQLKIYATSLESGRKKINNWLFSMGYFMITGFEKIIIALNLFFLFIVLLLITYDLQYYLSHRNSNQKEKSKLIVTEVVLFLPLITMLILVFAPIEWTYRNTAIVITPAGICSIGWIAIYLYFAIRG